MICNNCGRKNEGKAKFCVKCGTKLSENETDSKMQKVDVQAPINRDNAIKNANNTVYKNEKKKSLKTIVIILLSIVGIFALYIGISKYKSENVPKKVIEKDLIGNKVNIGSMDIEINKENLKSIKLEDKIIETEFGIRTYQNNCIIVLEDKNYKIELPVNVVYIYDGRNRSWMLGTNQIYSHSEDVKVEIKEKASEDIVKKAFIGEEINGVKITEEVANGLIIESMEEMEHGAVINAHSTLENKENFVTKKIKLESKISFDGEKWNYNNGLNRSSGNNIIINNPSGELTTAEIKKDLKMLIGNNKFSGYKGYRNISISLDDISDIKDLKVESITNNKGLSYIVTANVAGRSNDLIFDGNIEITVSEDGYADCNINFNKDSVDNTIKEEAKEVVGELYRVRKNWADTASQKGAYTVLDSAITECKKYSGYIVYNSAGVAVFSNSVSTN